MSEQAREGSSEPEKNVATIPQQPAGNGTGAAPAPASPAPAPAASDPGYQQPPDKPEVSALPQKSW